MKREKDDHPRPGAARVEAALLASASASARAVGCPRQPCGMTGAALPVGPRSTLSCNDNTRPTMGQGECSGKDC